MLAAKTHLPATQKADEKTGATVPGNVVLQTKPTLGDADNKYEQEADNVADTIMRMPDNNFVQRKCSECEEEEQVQRKPLSTSLTPFIQTKSNAPVNRDTADAIQSSKGGGTLLDGETQSFMGSRLGNDFSQVKIHTDNTAVQLSRNLNAKAFTSGNDVYFNEGQFDPNSSDGKHLLAHELAHTIQQNNTTQHKSGINHTSANNAATIQRAPMPAESTITNLESYTAGTRQNVRYDPSLFLRTNLAPYFKPGVALTSRAGYNITFAVRGFDPATESWLENGLKALALFSFSLEKDAAGDAITNFTTVEHLDMTNLTNPADENMHGPDALVQLTVTAFDATGSGKARMQNVQLLVEKMSNFVATASTEKAEDRRKRFATSYQIKNAVPVVNDPLGDPPEAMTDAQFDQVTEALNKVLSSILSQVTGITVHRGLAANGPNGEGAEYTQTKAKGSSVWERRITVYASFFSASPEQKTFLMAHELGHALDFRPNEASGKPGGPVLSAATGKDSFGKALQSDGGVGKGMSTYSATSTSEKEYYAEAFTMYINQPDTLKALRPNIYAYFKAQYP